VRLRGETYWRVGESAYRRLQKRHQLRRDLLDRPLVLTLPKAIPSWGVISYFGSAGCECSAEVVGCAGVNGDPGLPALAFNA
jgi:hypothetical protein